MSNETLAWTPVATVQKYDDEQTEWAREKSGILTPSGRVFDSLGMIPYETLVSEGNLVTTAGLNRLTALLIASGATQALTNLATRLGTGNGAAGAVVGDTDLGATAGAANRWFQVMDATYPQQANGVLTVKATFATGDGNYAWNEWGIDVGAPTVSSSAVVSALLFNHKTSAALGTKTSGSWVLTATCTIS